MYTGYSMINLQKEKNLHYSFYTRLIFDTNIDTRMGWKYLLPKKKNSHTKRNWWEKFEAKN